MSVSLKHKSLSKNRAKVLIILNIQGNSLGKLTNLTLALIRKHHLKIWYLNISGIFSKKIFRLQQRFQIFVYLFEMFDVCLLFISLKFSNFASEF